MRRRNKSGLSYKIISSLTILNVSLDSLQAFCLRSAYCYASLTQGRLSLYNFKTHSLHIKSLKNDNYAKKKNESGLSNTIILSLTILNVSLDSLQAFCLWSAYCYASLTQGCSSLYNFKTWVVCYFHYKKGRKEL